MHSNGEGTYPEPIALCPVWTPRLDLVVRLGLRTLKHLMSGPSLMSQVPHAIQGTACGSEDTATLRLCL